MERINPIRCISKSYLGFLYKKVLVKDKKGKKKMVPVDTCQIGDKIYTLEDGKWTKTTIR